MRYPKYAAGCAKVVVASMLVCILFGFTSTSDAQTIQQQLQKQLPTIIDYCNRHNIKTVGVLKFRTKKPGERMTDSAGPINSLIADRLECGLILANPYDESKQINVIKNASQQLLNAKGANHLTAEGRQACFDQEYEIAWGESRMKPDAFLTGIVQMHKDGESISIGILCFKSDGAPIEKACDVFQAEIDANTASEIGESFVMRAGVDATLIKGLTRNLLEEMRRKPAANQQSNKSSQKNNNQLNNEQMANVKSRAAVKKSTQVRAQGVPFPLYDPSAPVRLVAFYDGQQMPIEIREGRAFLPEPKADQRVEFLLVRGDSIVKRMAVVLKVNGENTLFRQTIRDFDCAKWLLSNQTKQIRVRGYQLPKNNEMEQFKVLTREESAKRAMDYGRQVGQIHMAVFQEADPTDSNVEQEEPDLIDEEDQDMLAMMRGTQPSQKPANLGALKQQIRKPDANELATRGLIVQGEKKKSSIKRFKVALDPIPVMAVTITYYSSN